MKLILGGLVVILTLLLSFQNCQKPPHADEINQVSLGSSAAQKVDLNQEVIGSVNLIFEDSKIVTKAGHSYQVLYNKTLKVDLNTGVIVESSDINSNTANYCLNEELKSELVSILKASQVCKSGSVTSSQEVCGQAIQLPYAQLITSREQFDLGSASDTCGNNSVDLCEDQPSLLKGYIQNLKAIYKQQSCSN
ncbi:MAG: hypothetical protein ABL930_03940 [Pseudobdellovibrio sp.]